MTKASRERIEKYQVNTDNVENDEESQNLEEARERGDWLFIFEAARETHMFQGATTDRVLLYEKQESPATFYRTCKFFNKKYFLEQNQRYYYKEEARIRDYRRSKSPHGGPTRGGSTPRAGGVYREERRNGQQLESK